MNLGRVRWDLMRDFVVWGERVGTKPRTGD